MINKKYYDHVIVGSSFSAIGALIALIEKKEKNICVILSHNTKLSNDSRINLISRNFLKYKSNIASSIHLNKMTFPPRSNFISYLGPGGLSNLWGKVMNTDNINITAKVKKKIINELKIRNNKKIFKKKINIYEINECNFKPINFIKKLSNKKKIKLILNKNVRQIIYDKKKEKYNLILNKGILQSNRVYLSAGFFSSIKMLLTLIKIKSPFKININHKKMLYGFFLSRKKNYTNYKNNLMFVSKQKYFAGRLVKLDDKVIKKYNFNFFIKIFYYFFKKTKYDIFLFNIFFKNSASTKLFVSNSLNILCNERQNKKYKNLLIANFKKSLSYFYNVLLLRTFETRPGSDFHYTSNLLKYSKFNFKNIILLSGLNMDGNDFFPTFKMICRAYEDVKKAVS